MKVIKVGTNSQSRIAQACDRCRSKKIRCDGITPCCTQCKNVGFECKTSDKLSRRAFPRGYTESLEERVRALEAEVRELKDLLDERDEKIDLLSKIHSFSSPSRASSLVPQSTGEAVQSAPHESRDDVFKVRQVPFLQKSEQKSDPFFMGASSARAFVGQSSPDFLLSMEVLMNRLDTVKCKVQESGKAIANIEPAVLFGRSDLAKPAKRADFSKNVSRLASDQLINIFFQEWSPLFPVLHRPTFLNVYSTYVSEPESIKDPIAVAQLNLVFGIAALANDVSGSLSRSRAKTHSSQSNKDLLPYFESQWQGALCAVIGENKLCTLQCLILAQLYCMAKGDYNKLLYYTGVAVNMCLRLGLHQSQKRFSLGALTRETRKKVFWTLYALDAFAAAALGLPKLMRDEDIETEEPADVDDENVNERGFQATLPGESTKLSSALALFRVARILSKVLKELYPASSSCELSLQRVAALSDELDAWRNALAPHLRLEFVQDKPCTNIISSRCPLLVSVTFWPNKNGADMQQALTYFHIRILIHRPVINSGLQAQAQPSLLAVADSSKHILQIIQLLSERHMSYTICINKMEIVTTCGFGLFLQTLDLSPESKLFKDTQQSLACLVEIMETMSNSGAIAFRKLSHSLFGTPDYVKPESRRSSSSSHFQPSQQESSTSARGHLQAIAARFSFGGVRQSKNRSPYLKQEANASSDLGQSALAERMAMYARAKGSQTSLSSTASDSVLQTRRTQSNVAPNMASWNHAPNLDYLPLEAHSPPHISPGSKPTASPETTDWDHLMSTFDPFEMTSSQLAAKNHDAAHVIPASIAAYNTSMNALDWSTDWGTNVDGWCLFDVPPQELVPAKSLPSISDESLSGSEELSRCDFNGEYRGYSIPHDDYRAEDLVAHPASL